MGPEELRRKIQRLESIASPSASLDRILSLAADCESDIADLEAAIALDPAVASRVLRLSNSAYFGVAGGVETISRAVLVIGYKNVLTLATCAAMAPVFQGDDDNLDRRALWRHSCAVGEAARIVADAARLDGSSAYVAGLLHDLGMAVLSEVEGPLYGEVLARVDAGGDLVEIERETLGVDHGWAASVLFESWSVPDRLLSAAGRHHAPENEPSGFAAIVAIADQLARDSGFEGPGECKPEDPIPTSWLHALGLEREQVATLEERLLARRGVIELGVGGGEA
ncbi:MAG: HDOD domain-containing protein [Myxococcota bacterium]|nr:HDOD domain-containing protein [Myxococcota bacterium]